MNNFKKGQLTDDSRELILKFTIGLGGECFVGKYRQTHRQTYIHTYTHTYIQTDRQTDIHTYRQTDIPTDIQTDKV